MFSRFWGVLNVFQTKIFISIKDKKVELTGRIPQENILILLILIYIKLFVINPIVLPDEFSISFKFV